jgi:hypothetical protein
MPAESISASYHTHTYVSSILSTSVMHVTVGLRRISSFCRIFILSQRYIMVNNLLYYILSTVQPPSCFLFKRTRLSVRKAARFVDKRHPSTAFESSDYLRYTWDMLLLLNMYTHL